MRTHCVRCGTCCRTTSPTLHPEDLDSIRHGFLKREHLVTLRKGEMVWDPVTCRQGVLRKEMIKVKDLPGGGCRLYDEAERACRIYEHRPIQCRELKCWDTRDLEARNRMPRLTRKDVLAGDALRLRLVEAHEQRCGYDTLSRLVKRLKETNGREVEPLLDLLRYDHAFRPFVSKKMGIPERETAFLFGRPLIQTIRMHGLRVEPEEGGFVLRPLST